MGTGIEPERQVESSELIPKNTWPVELKDVWESKESVVCLPPATQKSQTAAGLSRTSGYAGRCCCGVEPPAKKMESFGDVSYNA